MSKIISFFIILSIGLLFVSTTYINSRPSVDLAKFIMLHPENVSNHMIKNGEILFSYKSNESLPVASTTKLLVAAAYANQASEGKINLNKKISIEKIKNLYLPNEQNRKFDKWLSLDDTVLLSNLIRAMIKFNSNAIEEFLIGEIGLTNINKVINVLNLKNHSKIVPPVSLQLALNGNKKVSAQTRPLLMKDAISIHSEITKGNLIPSALNLSKSKQNYLNTEFQPEATTKEYTTLLDNILGYQNLDDKTIDALIPFLFDVTYDENGSEVYIDQASIIQSRGTQDFYNLIIYNKEASSDERFVSSYFFTGLTSAEISILEDNIEDLITTIRKENNLKQVIQDLKAIAFD